MSRIRPPRTCRHCGAPVLWWRNANRDSNICVDASPDDNGNVRKLVTTDRYTKKPVVWGKKLTPDELARLEADGPLPLLFTLHSATCSALRRPNPKPAGLEIPGLATRKNRR